MANGNNGKIYKWIAGTVVAVALTVVGWLAHGYAGALETSIANNGVDISNLQNQIHADNQVVDYDVDSVKDDLNDIKVDVKALSVKQTHMHDEIKELKDMVRQLSNP